MFQHYSPGQNESSHAKKKIITLMQNGHPEKAITFQISHKKGLTKQQICKACQKAWGQQQNKHHHSQNQPSSMESSTTLNQLHTSSPLFTPKSLRIFSTEAFQYYDEDLAFIKHSDRLYISRGEEFDSNRNFNEYVIQQPLGQGGFGNVFAACNVLTGQKAAIKIVKDSSIDVDMVFKQAQNLRALNHPNIVKIKNCYTMNDMRVVIVMEYMEGGELLGLLNKQKNGRFQQREAKGFFKQIANGVAYCHRQGIVHRDLKLENILLKQKQTQDYGRENKDGKESRDKKKSRVVKIADFGISGVANRFNPDVDWGTLRYMAPQVLSGKTKLNSQSVDVWACGVILFQMLTGKFPFNGNSSSQIIDSILTQPLVFPDQILLTIKCKDIIKLMLQKNPIQRITISEVEDHPWINQNLTAMAVIETVAVNLNGSLHGDGDGQVKSPKLRNSNGIGSKSISIKTVGSEDIGSYEDKEIERVDYEEYDVQDVKRMRKLEIIGMHGKNGDKKLRLLKDRRQDKNPNMLQRKSINIPRPPNAQIKIPKRLQKQKDQIIEQLRNYKEYKLKQKQKQREQKERKKTIANNEAIISQEHYRQKQQGSKILPTIINKRQNKYSTNVLVNPSHNLVLQKKQKQRQKIPTPSNAVIKNCRFNNSKFEEMP